MNTRRKTTKKPPTVSNLFAMNIAFHLNEQLQKMNIRNLDIAKNQYANAVFFKTIKEDGVFYFNAVYAEHEKIEFNVQATFCSTIKNWEHYCQETFGKSAETINLEIANIENLALQIKELFSVTYAYDELEKCRQDNNHFLQCLSSDGYPLTSIIEE